MKDAVDLLNERIAELEAAVLREKRRVDRLHQCINERDAQLAEARDLLKWRTDLPANLDECMDIAVPLRVGWFRCIGYVLQDLTITDFDHEHVGYAWEEGAMWRPATDPDKALAGGEAEGEQ